MAPRLQLIRTQDVSQRRTDNKMTKRKRKKKTTIYTTVHRKLKIEQHEPTKNQK
jgi:hypothetical protein